MEFMPTLRRLERLLDLRRWYLRRRYRRQYQGLSREEAFERIYRDRLWGADDDPGQPFYSGIGSRRPRVVEPYVAAVRTFLGELPAPPVFVDVGCGDFAVARRFTDLLARYVGCDIVDALIRHNQGAFAGERVAFQRLDAVRDPWPEGDVVSLRQVLQHLANDEIAAVLPKLGRYRYALITEEVPKGPFPANLEHTHGPKTRGPRSGVVLHAPPFQLAHAERRVLAETDPAEGSSMAIRTTLYRMAQQQGN